MKRQSNLPLHKEEKMQVAYDICTEEDRSIEYMLEYIQEYANVPFDEVLQFLAKQV